MRAAWPDEPMRCEVLPEGTTDDQIFAADLQKYNEMGWKRIAPTFGVDVRGRPTRCTLPQVYALIKLKAILAALTGLRATNTVKARPISPHTKILLKYVFNRMATAYHFALTKINTQRITRMWTTAEYPVRLRDERAVLQAQHSATGGGKLKYLREI